MTMKTIQKHKLLDSELSTLSSDMEQIIDKQGIQCVLSTIEEICYGKAQHLRDNWQSVSTHGLDSPKSWERAAIMVGRAWTECGNVGI
jgi:hypothetical protein